MTKIFDDNARMKVFKEYGVDYFDIKINVKDIIVKEISVKEARGFISMFHYSKTMPDSTKYVYGGFVGDKLIGIVCYGMGCGKNQYTSVIKDIENGEYIELTRVWCNHNAPKNTESKIISSSLKMLPSNIKIVISFADESKNHCGIIYQATNWNYLGKNGGGKMMVDSEGKVKHPRLIGIYRKRHSELKELSTTQIMDIYGWRYIEGGCKHKYLYVRGNKKYRKNIIKSVETYDYPKCNKGILKTDIQILNEFYEITFEKVVLAKREVEQLKWVI